MFLGIAMSIQRTSDSCAAHVSNTLHTNLVADIERRRRYLPVYYLSYSVISIV